MKVSARRKAREFAVQALYSWQMTGNPIADVELHFIAENTKRKFDIEYFQYLFRGTCTRVGDMDALISPYIDRSIDEVDLVEKAILRVAVFELTDSKEVPYRVVINEAIEVAKSFAAEDSHKFVNGVLDKVVKQIHG